MNEQQDLATTDELSFREKHSFTLFITISILIASVIMVISMAMYNSSGAAQLDLSRPGYVSVRSQAGNDEKDFQNYPTSGSINKKVISEFKELYSKQANKVKSVDAFGGDPLSFEALGISVPVEP